MKQKLNLNFINVPIFILSILIIFICSGCTKDVTDYELSLKFQDQDITGKYTGQLIDNVASSENATFTYSNGDDYLNYTGAVENGSFSGNGTLETNFYVVHFKDTDRIGEYKGEVVDGIPKGNGSFTATNDSNETYTYTGEWDNGTFNGQGQRKFENNKYRNCLGTWIDGEYCPTMIEYLSFVGQDLPDNDTDTPFTISDSTAEFIENHSNIFPTANFEDITTLVDSSVEFKHLMKNISGYNQNLIKCDAERVAAIYEFNEYGFDITTIQITEGYGEAFYYVYYFGKLDDIFEGDNVLIYGLPLDTTHFTNISNTTTQAVVVLGSYVAKK